MSVVLRIGHGARHGAAPLDTRIRRAVRRCIEDEVVRLIDMLDGLDVDPDLELTGDEEPYLGWPALGPDIERQLGEDDLEDDAGDGCGPISTASRPSDGPARLIRSASTVSRAATSTARTSRTSTRKPKAGACDASLACRPPPVQAAAPAPGAAGWMKAELRAGTKLQGAG